MSAAPTKKRKYAKGSFYRVPPEVEGAVEQPPLKYWEYAKSAEINGEKRRVKSTSVLEDEREAFMECVERWNANVERARANHVKKPTQKRASGKPAPSWTLAQYAAHWLKNSDHLTADRRHTTEQRLNQHVLPHVGNIRISDFSATDSQHLFKTVLVQKGLGAHGRANARKTLSQMLKYAREREHPPLLYHYPVLAEHARQPKGRKQEETELIWERAAVSQRMLSEAENASHGGAQPFLHLWLCLNFMGLRRAEISGLTWGKVRTGASGSIKIHGQYLYRREWRGSRYTGGLKTTNGRREFGLTEQLNAALIRWRQEQDELKDLPGWKPQDQDYVLTHPDGRPFTGNDQQEFWTEYKAEFFKGVPELAERVEASTWVQHFNRHITASLFKDWSISYEDTRRILGHGDAALTETIYTQTRPESLKETMKRISEGFANASNEQRFQDEVRAMGFDE